MARLPDGATLRVRQPSRVRAMVGFFGPPGRGIASIDAPASAGQPGATDTYTIVYTAGESDTFEVTNGQDGDTGPAGLTARGAWVSGTTYAVNDVVTSGGSTWRRKTAGAGTTAPVEGTTWELLAAKGSIGDTGPAGLTPKGTWVSGTTYAVNDLVVYSGSAYRRKTAGAGTTPPVDGTTWELLVAKGDTGPAGVTPRGAWASGTAYAVNDLATYAGSTWRRLIAGTTTATPDADTTNWAIFAQKGTDGASSAGTPPTVQTFTASGTWTKPANAVRVLVECRGGGGGGIGNVSRGGGGGGGGYAAKSFAAADLPANASVTVGAGGNGGTNGVTAATAGGASSFGSLLTVSGGVGGTGTTGGAGGGLSGAPTVVGGGGAAVAGLHSFWGGGSGGAGSVGGNSEYGGAGGAGSGNGDTNQGGRSLLGGNGGASNAGSGVAPSGGGAAGQFNQPGGAGARGEVTVTTYYS